MIWLLEFEKRKMVPVFENQFEFRVSHTSRQIYIFLFYLVIFYLVRGWGIKSFKIFCLPRTQFSISRNICLGCKNDKSHWSVEYQARLMLFECYSPDLPLWLWARPRNSRVFWGVPYSLFSLCLCLSLWHICWYCLFVNGFYSFLSLNEILSTPIINFDGIFCEK